MIGQGRTFTSGGNVVSSQPAMKDVASYWILSEAHNYCNKAMRQGAVTELLDISLGQLQLQNWYMKMTLNVPNTHVGVKGKVRAKGNRCGCEVDFTLTYTWYDKGDLNLNNTIDRFVAIWRGLDPLYYTGHDYQDFPVRISWDATNHFEMHLPKHYLDVKIGWPLN